MREIEENISEDEAPLMNNELAGECYICFSKLLKTELRLFDRRDSFMIRNSMSMSRKHSTLDVHSHGAINTDTSEDLNQRESGGNRGFGFKAFSSKFAVGDKALSVVNMN